MVSIVLAYALLGWRLSALPVLWLVESWAATIIMVFLLIWRGGLLTRWFRVGPTVLVSIFFASFTIVFAIAYAEFFALALVLLLSIFWGRLELHARRLHQTFVLGCLCFLSGSGLTLGWILGQRPQFIETILFRLHH